LFLAILIPIFVIVKLFSLSSKVVHNVKKSVAVIDDDISTIPLTIYPNPVKNDLFIKSDLPIKKVEIYSLTGSLIITDNNFIEKISVSTLSKGIYLLKVYTDKGVAISKILKE
jgi:predicted ATP-grasp superfamily ATP-dependent carboligase